MSGRVATSCCAVAMLAGVCAAGSWPQFRGDPAQTGATTERLPTRLHLLWTHETNSGVESTAAIVGGRVFVGLADGGVLALDLATGKHVWKCATAGGVRASACVAGGRVFIGDDTGVFYAIRADTGKLAWRFDTRSEQEILSSAACVKGRVLFGSYDSHLYCLSASDGTLRWKYQTEAQVHCAPCVADGAAVVAGCDAWLRAISLKSGKETEKVSLKSNVAATPAFDGNRLYVPTLNGRVLAVKWGGGGVAWRFVPRQRGQFYASAAVSGKAVVVADRRGSVRRLDADKGTEVWSFRAGGPVDSSPVIAGDNVYVGCDAGNLYALDLATGRPEWQFAAGSALKASPAVAEGRLVIGSDDGAIYCFGARLPKTEAGKR